MTSIGYLALADGSVYEGTMWGAAGHATGEVVFTTGMTGYQEVLTDPSYTGQIVCMTAAHVGNTGITADDGESRAGQPHVAGYLMHEACRVPSSHRSRASLDAYLVAHGIVALAGVDTRRLVRALRDTGVQTGCIGAGDRDELVDRARAASREPPVDLVARVTPDAPYAFAESREAWAASFEVARPIAGPGRLAAHGLHVVAIDYGAKRNLLRCLVDAGCRVTCVPASTSAAAVLALAPDGIFLSNGPGDPEAVGYATRTVAELLGKRPMFGICLGHQLLARALGATTYKLKFGHRGLNQPVQDVATGRVQITLQNHGYAVDLASLAGRAHTTHLHLNDGTSEGLAVPDARAFSVQYHPEAAAGPHDALALFQQFVTTMRAA
jgi:carbamoyl-phosphate synthase small subunit